ncbi:MAG TPA: hypothetical protein VKE22_23415 [Haliangiales bacterium]|nr:hypothetical protein [Haliangiales bacterium]
MRVRTWLLGICLVASLATGWEPLGAGPGRAGVSARGDRGDAVVAPARDHAAARRSAPGRQAAILPPSVARGDADRGVRPAPARPACAGLAGEPAARTLHARAPPPSV